MITASQQSRRSQHPVSTGINYMLAGNFALDVQNFMNSRMDRIIVRDMSREAAEENRTCIDLYERIRAMLPETGQKLLSDLDSTWGNLDALSQDVNYRCGFSDGVRFLMQTLAGGNF